MSSFTIKSPYFEQRIHLSMSFFLPTQQCSLGALMEPSFGHDAHGEEHHPSTHTKVTRQSFHIHSKFVQLTLEQDFPREHLPFTFSTRRIFSTSKIKSGPTLGDQIPNVNDTATQEKCKNCLDNSK